MTEWQDRVGEIAVGIADSPASCNVLVLGLGNPLRGDDGIGPRVVEELVARRLPEGVAVLDAGAGGLDLLRMMEGWDQVVIVDAADVDAGRGQIAPGEFVRFTPEQARLRESSHAFSLHHAGLAEVLRLARALGRSLPSIIIFGMQPEDVGWGEGLSPNVEAAIPRLIEAILEEVERIVTVRSAAPWTPCTPA
jgi:hydrogenase maturation protease